MKRWVGSILWFVGGRVHDFGILLAHYGTDIGKCGLKMAGRW